MKSTYKKKILLSELTEVKKILRRSGLHSICEESRCPNISECFSRRTATFLILGNVCTRNCSFCNVRKGKPCPVDLDEPRRLALTVKELDIRYAVVTSVTRDDLSDGGADIFCKTIEEIKKIGSIKIEVLIPDFQGRKESLEAVVGSSPDVVSHNVETVPRLYPELRNMADYLRSLNVLKTIKTINPAQMTKSGIMLGLGETENEVLKTMAEVRDCGCDFFSIGQYLPPSNSSYKVVRHLPAEEFAYYSEKAEELGFEHVESGTFVRTSYNASCYLSSSA